MLKIILAGLILYVNPHYIVSMEAAEPDDDFKCVIEVQNMDYYVQDDRPCSEIVNEIDRLNRSRY